MNKKIYLMFLLYCFNQMAFALEVFKTGIPLSSSLGSMYCQNIVQHEKSDWRMPELPDLLELLNDGVTFEQTHCSNTTRESSITLYKCITPRGELTERTSSHAEEIICVRGESEFVALPLIEECPTASFSMTTGILHLPLLNVPNLLGDIEKYNVDLKMVSDDLIFEFSRATRLE